MPAKIGFQVILCTGEDDRYRASELNYHGPTVRGWRSPFNCTFPQEIVFRLDVPAVLHQIQILVHQYLIPQKIEIFTNESSDLTEISPSQDSLDQFDYLGFITFSENKATGFRSRELKSILIPSRNTARYVKLRIHNNHVNNKNLFNQVGIIGINILGDEIDDLCRETEFNNINNNNNNNVYHRSKVNITGSQTYKLNYISPYDDLAFEMYVDEETAKIIRCLEWKKQQAIFEENYEEANILKLTLENLRSAGEILGLYEQEKKQAVQLEDFDQAKLKKMQITNFREKVYSALGIDQLLNSRGDNEENASIQNPPIFDNFNNKSVLKCMRVGNGRNNTDFRNEFIENMMSPRKNVSRQESSGGHLTHSKSQTSFSNQKESPSPDFLKKHCFSSSKSNPHIRDCVRDEEEEENLQEEITNVVDGEIHVDRDASTPSSSASSSSDSEESAIFTSSDVLKCPSESLGSITVQPLSRSIERIEEKNETLVMSWNDNSRARTPPDRSRSRLCEDSRLRSKSLTNSVTKSSFEAYEDRMVPALKSYHGNEIVRGCQLGFAQQPKTKLNERERKQAALPISIFGMEMIEKFYSKSFNDKEEGLRDLQRQLRRVMTTEQEVGGKTKGSYNKMARAAIFLLHRALRDKVYSVYSGAAETIRMFFAEFVPERVSASEVARSVEKLLPELLTKSGDVTPRIHNMAAHTLLSMAECVEVRRLNIIPSRLSRPLMSGVHPRLALSRLEMVEQLILNHGISRDKRSGLTCRTLAEFGSSGLHHPAEAVRKVSERILIQVYRVNPRIVRKQLPPDDNVTRRNLLYRHLFQEFDFMDMQRKMGEQENKEAEQEVEEVEEEEVEEELKHKIIDQTIVGRAPSSERKAFSINNIPEHTKAKSANFDSQLKTIKNFMSLNLRETNTINKSVLKDSAKCSSLSNKSPNRVKTESTPKVEFNLENDRNRFKKSSKELPSGSSSSSNNNNNNNEKKKERKSQNNLRTTNANKVENAIKFPSLTDSIETTKARMAFDQRKVQQLQNAKPLFPKDQSGNESRVSKDAKKNRQLSSGIPLPTFGSTRKLNATAKTDKKEKQGNSMIKKRFDNDDNVRLLTCDQVTNQFESAEEKKLLEMAAFKKEMLETLQKNNSNNNNNNNGLFPDEIIRHGLTKNAGKDRFHKIEKNNRFSESMLASIRENDYPVNSMHNDLEKERRTLKTCIFCLSSEKWAGDDGLNDHYLRDCPMLTTCEYCLEVIEISGFKNHLLYECSQKHLFKKCPKCQQAVLDDLINNHECLESSTTNLQTRCPFCQTILGDDDNSWRQHLMGNNVCSNHPRQI